MSTTDTETTTMHDPTVPPDHDPNDPTGDRFRRSLAAGPPLALLDAAHALAGEVGPYLRPLSAGPPLGLLRAARAIRAFAEVRRASEAAAEASKA